MTEQPEKWHERNVICPYCGSEDIDSWERSKGEWETDMKEDTCWSCDKKFKWKRGFDVWYDTEGMER